MEERLRERLEKLLGTLERMRLVEYVEHISNRRRVIWDNLLYGMMRGWDAEKCLHFGWATGAFVATLETDFGLPADEEQIWSIWEGNARVKR